MAEKPSLDEIFARPPLDSIFNPSKPTLLDKAKEVGKRVLDTGVDEALTVGNLLTSPVKMIGQGYGALAAGAGALSAGGNLDDALNAGTDYLQKKGEEQYQPTTPVGKSVHKVAAYPFEKLSEARTNLIEERQRLRGPSVLDVPLGVATELIPFAIGVNNKAPIVDRPIIPEEVRLARSIEGAVPVGEGALVTPERPSRTRQEPVLNDMPPVGPEVQRRNQIQEVFDRDGEVLANQIADRREQPVLFESPDFPRPEYEPLDPRVEAWKEAEALAAAEIADGIARQRSMPIPIGEGTLDAPVRTNVPPRLNDMPQPQRLLPEPDRFTGRRADIEAAIAADEAAKLQAMADGRQQPNLFETRPQERPTYELEDSRIDNWKAGQEDLAAQIAEARKQPSGWANHDALKGETVVTAADSLQTSPKVKPVIKGTVSEVSELAKGGTLNPKDHQVFYPEGKQNPESPAYIIRKQGIDRPIEAVKQELRMGGDAESRWLGYPDRTNVPSDKLATVAVTKDGQVVVDPARIMEESANKNVAWAAEGRPEEVISKAQEVVNASKDIPLEEKSSPTSNLGVTDTLPASERGDIKDLHAGIHPKEITRAIKATTDFINDWIPPTFKDRFQNFLSLPQRIAASGKYPSYTELYKKYREWDEGRNSIAAKLFESVDAKNLRKQQNNMSRVERTDLAQVLSIGEQDKRFFTREELLNGQNPLGRPVSPRVAEVYQGIRDLYHNTLQEDFKQQVETAMHPYKDEPWFASLKELVDNDVPVSVLKAEIERSGKLVDKRLVDALREINEVKRVIEEEIIPHYSMNPEYVNHVRPEGDYRVSVYELNPDGSRGKEIYMRTAKSAGAAKQLIGKLRKDPTNVEFGFPQNYKRLLAENGEAIEGMQYEIGTPERMGNVNEEVYKYSGSMSAKEIELNNAITDAVSKGKINGVDANKVKDAIIDVLHKRQLSRGFGRHKLARQGQLIEGFDMSDPVGLALGYARTMAGFHTKARYAIDAAKEFKKAPKEEHYLMNEFIQDTLTNQNSNLVKAGALVRQNLVLTQLAYRAVAPLLNYTQNYVWAAPELASVFEKNGVVGKNALVEIKKAQGNILKNSLDNLVGNGKQSLEPIVKRALDEFDRTGAAEAQNVREVAGLGQGAHVQYLTKATELGMKPFSYIERAMNREANFVAAFKNLMESGKTYEQAFEIAKDYSLNVNIDASAHNYPGLVRKTGEAGKTLYTFGRYGHSYLSWLFQKAILHQEYKPVVRSMVVLGALGGTMGLPFVNEMNKFLERFLGVSPKLALRKAIKEKTEQYGIEEANAFVEDLVMNGVPAAVFDINISRSVAPSLPIISEVIASGDVGKGLTGAVGGMVARTGRMFDAYGKGDTLRAVENVPVLPIGAANLVNAYRQSTEGVTTTSGKPVIGTDGSPIKMSGGEAAVKGLLGSNPQRIAREQDIRDSMFTMKEKYQSRLDKIKQKAKRKGWSPELRQEFKDLKDEAAYYKVPIKFSQRISRPRRDRRYTQSIKTYNYITEGDD